MALARGSVIRPVNFEIPTVQLPLEAMYAQMQQYQGQKDAFDQATSLMPEYLTQDANAANVYRTLKDDLSKSVLQAFDRGNTGEAMRALRSAQNRIKEQWMPGGLATALQSRYKQYQTALGEIKEGTKNNKSSIYQNYYKRQLDKSVGNIDYDPNNKTFRSIATPSINQEIILGDEADKFLKGWMADQGVEIIKSADGMWYNKKTREVVSPQELKTALGRFYEQPHIRQALTIYSDDRVQQLTPEAKKIYQNMYSDKINQEIDKKLNQINGLDKIVASGNRRKIQEVQEMLKQSGYDVDIDGLAGPKTRDALIDFKTKSIEDLEQSRRDAKATIDTMPINSFVEQQIKDDITNTYVPKYAYTKEDIDMIANTPLLTKMRIDAQRKTTEEAINRLTATMFPPDATLIAPVAVNPTEVSTLSKDFEQQRAKLTQAEQTLAKSLSPSFLRVMGGIRLPLSTTVEAMFTSVQSSIAGNVIDPKRYKEAMAQQGIALTDGMVRQHLDLLASSNARSVLTGLHDNLVPLQASTVEAKELFYRQADRLVKSGKIDFESIAAGYNQSPSLYFRPGPFADKGIRLTADQAKQMFYKNDPAVVAAVERQVKGKMSQADVEKHLSTTTNVILNKKLAPFVDQLKDMVKSSSIASLVDFSKLSKSERQQLGLTNRGDIAVGKDGKPVSPVTSLEVGFNVVDGKTVPVVIVRTQKMRQPMAFSMDALLPSWRSTLINNVAASAINPNNPSQVLDETVLGTAAALRFDQDQDQGTAFRSSAIWRRANEDLMGSIGLTNVRTDQGVVPVNTYVVKDKPTGKKYLVAAAGATSAQRMKGVTTVNIDDVNADPNLITVEIGNSYDDVNKAIMGVKAFLYRQPMLEKAYQEPYNVTKRPSNLTADPGVMSEMFNVLTNDF